MKKYIDKATIVAEIEKRRTEWQYGSSIEAKYKSEECDDILSFLDTLEVKEVDLEQEIELIKGDYEQVDVAWLSDGGNQNNGIIKINNYDYGK